MDTKSIIQSVFKELILPEFDVLKAEIREVKAVQAVTNKRLDDMNAQLIEQSRRIDQINIRIDQTNERINSLYEVIVRREEHEKADVRITNLEHDVAVLKQKLAA